MTNSIDWSRRARVADGVLDAAGLTPAVRLKRIAPEGVEIIAKLEYLGPSGSVKDRILPTIVRRAIERGELRPGMTIIEGTTGNTGIATSMVGAKLKPSASVSIKLWSIILRRPRIFRAFRELCFFSTTWRR